MVNLIEYSLIMNLSFIFWIILGIIYYVYFFKLPEIKLDNGDNDNIIDLTEPIQQGFTALSEQLIFHFDEKLTPESFKPIIQEAVQEILPEFTEVFMAEISKALSGQLPPTMQEQSENMDLTPQVPPQNVDIGQMIQMMIMQKVASMMGGFGGGGGSSSPTNNNSGSSGF